MAYYNGKYVDITYTGDISAETLREEVANAIKETVSGEDAVRLDGVSPIPHNIDVTLEPVNLINQEEFLSTDMGKEYKLELNENNYFLKYFLKAEIKEGAVLDGVNVSIYLECLGNDQYYQEIHIISNGAVEQMPIRLQIPKDDGFVLSNLHIFVKDDSEEESISTTRKLSDVFESVLLTNFNFETKDIADVQLKSYGKNLDSYNPNTPTTCWDTKVPGNYAWYTLNVPCDVTLTLFRDQVIGTFTLYEYDESGNVVGNAQTLFNTTSKLVVSESIEKTEGHTYKLRTSKNVVNLLDASTFKFWLQVEVGKGSGYEEYKEPVDSIVAILPTTTLVADTNGVKITATYNKDTNKVIQELKNAILNLGGIINV